MELDLERALNNFQLADTYYAKQVRLAVAWYAHSQLLPPTKIIEISCHILRTKENPFHYRPTHPYHDDARFAMTIYNILQRDNTVLDGTALWPLALATQLAEDAPVEGERDSTTRNLIAISSLIYAALTGFMDTETWEDAAGANG